MGPSKNAPLSRFYLFPLIYVLRSSHCFPSFHISCAPAPTFSRARDRAGGMRFSSKLGSQLSSNPSCASFSCHFSAPCMTCATEADFGCLEGGLPLKTSPSRQGHQHQELEARQMFPAKARPHIRPYPTRLHLTCPASPPFAEHSRFGWAWPCYPMAPCTTPVCATITP